MQSHRSTLYITLLAIAFVIVFVIGFTTTAKDMLTTERQQTDQRYSATENAVQALADALQTHEEEHREEIKELLRIISELQSEIEERTFMPDPDIPLSVEFQMHTYYRSCESDIPPEIMFNLMRRESGFHVDAVGYNANGTRDHGLCQINDVAFDFLRKRGIDPTESPEANIDAAVELITYYRDELNCTLLEALAAYGVGYGGMKRGGGLEAAKKLMEG